MLDTLKLRTSPPLIVGLSGAFFSCLTVGGSTCEARSPIDGNELELASEFERESPIGCERTG